MLGLLVWFDSWYLVVVYKKPGCVLGFLFAILLDYFADVMIAVVWLFRLGRARGARRAQGGGTGAGRSRAYKQRVHKKCVYQLGCYFAIYSFYLCLLLGGYVLIGMSGVQMPTNGLDLRILTENVGHKCTVRVVHTIG